jgi:hypothetical protein
MVLMEGFKKDAESQINHNAPEEPVHQGSTRSESNRPGTASCSGGRLRRISLPSAKRPQSSTGFQVPPVRPSSCPPVRPASCPPVHPLDGDLPSNKTVDIKDFKWVRTRIIRKLPEIFLSSAKNLFLARFTMRLVVFIGRVLLGMGALWLTPSSLFLFWAAEYLIFRKCGPNHLTFFAALWSLGIFFAGNSIWVASISDALLFITCIWGLRKVEGRFLTAADAAELEKTLISEEFWKEFFRSGTVRT